MYDLTQDYPVIKAALREACEQFAERVDRYGGYDAAGWVREISAKSYDGYIAHTNGGFRVCIPCDLRTIECEGLTDFETEILQVYIDQAHADAAAAFVEEHETLSLLFEAYEESGGTMSAIDWLYARWDEAEDMFNRQPQLWPIEFWQTPIYAEREELWEYEDQYLCEGGTFFYELRVLFYEKDHRRNATGEDEIYIFAGINTDFEYGRERGLQCAIERDYKLSRLTPARIATIVESFGEKL